MIRTTFPILRWGVLALLVPMVWACTSHTFEAPAITPTATLTATVTQKISNDIDLLFMIDNSSSMTAMQQKLAAQLPTFMQVLETLPMGLPNVHIAVVSSDMGAPGNADGCTLKGDDGQFKFMPGPVATCTSTTLSAGSTFISDVDGVKNFTDPIDSVFGCVALLGSQGCGFEHQLASIDRALGADGTGTPTGNENFLRKDAYLGIVILTNEDDCSAKADSTIYSLNGGPQSIANPDGPLANYRCNGGPRGAHLCTDPATGKASTPPLKPPSDASGDPPVLALSNCQDDTSGMSALIPVSRFVQDIRNLKTQPDEQILVAAITAPAAPYAVEWLPPDKPTPSTANELWPQVMHSCGAAGSRDLNPKATQTSADGSFGDPGVRITEFVSSFHNSLVASICDETYRTSMTEIANKLGGLIKPKCIADRIQNDAHGQPMCVVVQDVTAMNETKQVPIPSCSHTGGAAPCWTLDADANMCPGGGKALKMNQDPAAANASMLSSSISCSICLPGSTAPGC